MRRVTKPRALLAKPVGKPTASARVIARVRAIRALLGALLGGIQYFFFAYAILGFAVGVVMALAAFIGLLMR